MADPRTQQVQLRNVAACPVCHEPGGSRIARRADGIAVLRCGLCSAAFVAQVPQNLDDYYDDGYFSRGPDPVLTTGYESYEIEFRPTSFLWAITLVQALEPASTEWLDIGTATGVMIELAQAFGYEVHGVELNTSVARSARARGLDVRGGRFDPSVWRGSKFGIITAFEVLEHVDDPQAFIKSVHSLLEPGGGLFCFLVPNVPQDLVDVYGDTVLDFRKSLEHTVYFERKSLKHLVESVFGPGSLSIATFDVEQSSGCASYALGFVRRGVLEDIRGRLLVRALGGELLALDGPTAASVALTLAKFGDQTGANAWLDRAEVAGTPAPTLARARAQVLRNAGALIASLVVLDDYLRQMTLGKDPVAEALFRDCLLDLLASVNPNHGGLGELLSEAMEQLAHDWAGSMRQVAAELEESRELLEVKQRLVEDLQRRLEDQGRQLDDYWLQIQELFASTSWRLTRALRAAGAAQKRLRSFKRAVAFADRRRVRVALRLLAKGEFRSVEQRMRAIAGDPILSTSTEPAIGVVHDKWPSDLPLVSVVIPCFNYGRYVNDAVSSVLLQTWRDAEVIVVDAGSTDAPTRDVVQSLPNRYGPRVRILLLKERALVGEARNRGLALARGKYICCLDADDMLKPNYLELAVFLLERYHYDVVSTAIELFGERQGIVGVLPRPTLDDMLKGNHIVTVGVVRRELWEKSGGYQDTGVGREHVYEDWRFWTRVMALGARAANLWHDALFAYRVHSGDSLSGRPGIPDMMSQRRAIAYWNSDVITDEARRRSALEAKRRYVVGNAMANLVRGDEVASQTVVLLVMPFLILGGAERLLSKIVAKLVTRNWRFVVMTTMPTEDGWGDSTSWFSTVCAEIYHLPKLLDRDDWLDFLDYVVEAKGVRILWMCGSTWMYGALAAIRGRHPELRVVDQLFNTVAHTTDNRRVRRDIDLHLVEDLQVREWLLTHGEDPERIMVVESGVDLDDYRPLTKAVGARLQVGYCGRMSEEKDPFLFLWLAAELRGVENVRFSMTGAGPLTSAVRKEIDRLGLGDRLAFLGVLSDDEMKAHLSGLDVLVLPSRVDGRPNVVMEAQACGVPVVASAVGSVPALVVDGKTGFLCAPGDREAFRDAVRRVLRDPALRSEMGWAARRHASERLDATAMYDRYEGALQALLVASRRGTPR